MNNITTDSDVILMALQKERDELHEKIMQVDRIIKKVRSLEYTSHIEIKEPKQLETKQPVAALNIFPKTTDVKILILRVFDILNIASKLKDIQSGFCELSGNQYSIRESMRTLNRAKLIKIIKVKNSNRGFLWVKTEWLEDGKLIDKYKPEGFDLLYKADTLIFE